MGNRVIEAATTANCVPVESLCHTDGEADFSPRHESWIKLRWSACFAGEQIPEQYRMLAHRRIGHERGYAIGGRAGGTHWQ